MHTSVEPSLAKRCTQVHTKPSASDAPGYTHMAPEYSAVADANLAEETNTGQDGSSRAVSEAASVPALSSFGRQSKRSRSITPEGGLMQHQHAQGRHTNVKHEQGDREYTQGEEEQPQWQGFAQQDKVADHKGSRMRDPCDYQTAASTKVEPLIAGNSSWHQRVKPEEDVQQHEGAIGHRLSRGLSSSQSLPTSSTDGGKPRKTGLKIKLKLKPS